MILMETPTVSTKRRLRLSLITGVACMAGLLSGTAVAQEVSETSDLSSPIIVYGRSARDTQLSVPQTIDVLDSQMLEAAGADTVGDALRFVPGASRQGGELDAFGDSYLIRGFFSNQTVNGLTTSALRQARDSVAVERIEVLKGPASVLYGQLQPGAVVNVVTKQPKREFGAELTGKYARFQDIRGTFDITGPLTDGGGLRARFTAAYDDADGYVDHFHRSHIWVGPSVSADFGESTTLTVEAFYTKVKFRGFLNGLPASGTVLPNPNGPLPRRFNVADPGLGPLIRENYDVSARLVHDFSDTVSLRIAGGWTHEDSNEQGVYGVLGFEVPDRVLTRAVLLSRGNGNGYRASADLSFDLKTGPLEHELVIGSDAIWYQRDYLDRIGLISSLDLYAPVFNTTPPTIDLLPGFSNAGRERSRTYSVFAQDRISLGENWKLIGGLRWSHYYQRNRITFVDDGTLVENQQTQNSWTSQIGILWTPTPHMSVFANRTNSFLPVQGSTAAGEALKPETGTQYELGAKAELLDNRLSITGAIFHLERGNVAVSDRVNPSALVPIGAQVAKGFEISATLRLADGWRAYAAYAYTKAKTTEDTNATLVGAPVRNVPKHTFAMQTDYSFQTGALAGLTLGAALNHVGRRTGDNQGSFDLPSYWQTDVRLDYALTDNITLGARIDNLFDEHIYTHSYSEFEVFPGAPRRWTVSAKLTY